MNSRPILPSTYSLPLIFAILSGCTPSSVPVEVASSTTTHDPNSPSNNEQGTSFSGMVRPTKGGYFVGEVVLDDDTLPRALAGDPARQPHDPDWFLGAVVRVVADLQHHEVLPNHKEGIGPIMQMRTGSWTQAKRVKSAKVVVPAAVIEGAIGRSKGYFVVAGRLIHRGDFAWALAPDGGQAGGRVRLYGQFRTETCEPNAQCLIEGELPLFDVGRAVRLP